MSAESAPAWVRLVHILWSAGERLSGYLGWLDFLGFWQDPKISRGKEGMSKDER